MSAYDINQAANWLLDASEGMDKVDSRARVNGATAGFVKAINHPTATAFTLNGSANGLIKTVEAMRRVEIEENNRGGRVRPDPRPTSTISH